MGSFASPLSSRTVSYATLRARHLDGSPRVLQLFGEADIATLGMLRRELAHLAATHQADVVVDVTGLKFCDVASAHLILTARRRVPVTIGGATGSVKRVLDLVSALQEQRLSSHSSLSRFG